MLPNEGSTNKSTKHKSKFPEAQSNTEKNKAQNPPGVSMPPETEMSPPQLG